MDPEVSRQAVASGSISIRKGASVTAGRATEITELDSKPKDSQKTCTGNAVCLEPPDVHPSKHSVSTNITRTLALLGVKIVAKYSHARQVALPHHSLFKVVVGLKKLYQKGQLYSF